MDEPTEKAPKPPSLQIGRWPAWLTARMLTVILVQGMLLLIGLYYLVWGSPRRQEKALVLLTAQGVLLVGFLLWTYVRRRRDAFFPHPPDPPPEPTTCEHCGYDLRATPLQCPECGNPTPLHAWLEARPLERAIYERRLTPVARGKKTGP